MEYPSLRHSGQASDLETDYLRKHTPILPLPPNSKIPFYKQGFPLPDPYQQHTTRTQLNLISQEAPSNPLPFTVWHGTFRPQINQGSGFLSINENRWS